jgi:hypothetical protein
MFSTSISFRKLTREQSWKRTAGVSQAMRYGFCGMEKAVATPDELNSEARGRS